MKPQKSKIKCYNKAIVFINSGGACFLGPFSTRNGVKISSEQYYVPPKVPKTFYVHIDKNNQIINENELEPIFNYYIPPKEYSKI